MVWMLRLRQTGPDAAIASNSVRMLRNQQSVSVFRMLRLQHRGPDADIATKHTCQC